MTKKVGRLPNRTERKKAARADAQLLDCAFCDENKGGSKEDVWPNWMWTIFKREEDTRILEVNYWNAETVVDIGPRAALTNFGICSDCNTGWMQKIEDAASPIFKNLIRARDSEITIRERSILLDWMMKTAMTLETRPSMPAQFFTRDERKVFRLAMKGLTTESPYPNVLRLWITGLFPRLGTPYSLPLPGHFEMTNGLKKLRIECFAFTFAGGYLALQLVAARYPPGIDSSVAFFVASNPRFDEVTRLYPSTPGRIDHWPPRLMLIDPHSRIDEFALRFSVPDPVAFSADGTLIKKT